MSLHIAYAGLGNMGTEMAVHLGELAQKEGYKLTVWNRSQDKYEGLRPRFSSATTFATTLQEVAAADIIFACLLNDAVDLEVIGQIIGAAREGTIIIDQSSVRPVTSRELENVALSKSIKFVSGPIFGRPPAAKAGKLIQVLAGDKDAKAKIRPLAASYSTEVLDLGDEAYKGTTLKLIGNGLILGVIELLGETYALGDAVGIDPKVFQHLFEVFPAAAYHGYSAKIADGDFNSNAGFKITTGLKDANNILSCGADLGHPVDLPVIQTAKKHMEMAAELGGNDIDWSALAAACRVEAGLPPWREGKAPEGSKDK